MGAEKINGGAERFWRLKPEAIKRTNDALGEEVRATQTLQKACTQYLKDIGDPRFLKADGLAPLRHEVATTVNEFVDFLTRRCTSLENFIASK